MFQKFFNFVKSFFSDKKSEPEMGPISDSIYNREIYFSASTEEEVLAYYSDKPKESLWYQYRNGKISTEEMARKIRKLKH